MPDDHYVGVNIGRRSGVNIEGCLTVNLPYVQRQDGCRYLEGGELYTLSLALAFAFVAPFPFLHAAEIECGGEWARLQVRESAGADLKNAFFYRGGPYSNREQDAFGQSFVGHRFVMGCGFVEEMKRKLAQAVPAEPAVMPADIAQMFEGMEVAH